MATARAALQMMRKVCLALPDSVESVHFGEARFRVGKRIFASCGEKDGVCRRVFQLTPEHARRLVASGLPFKSDARQKNCVWIDAADVDDWDEVRALDLESYRLNEPAVRSPGKTRRIVHKKSVRR